MSSHGSREHRDQAPSRGAANRRYRRTWIVLVVLVTLLMPSSASAINGGEVQHNPHIYPIFWGSNWNTGAGPSVRAQLTALYGNISGSAWQGILTQYWDDTGYVSSTITTSSAYTDSSEKIPPKEITTNTIWAEILHALEQNPTWSATRDAQFAVFPAPGSTYVNSSACGYHGDLEEKETTAYTFVGYAGDPPFSGCLSTNGGGDIGKAMTSAASHEYAEAVTDSYGEGWTFSGSEVADICNERGYISTSWVQGLYDLYKGGCQLSDPNPPQITNAVTEGSKNVTSSQATAFGSVNPGGHTGHFFVEYGPTTKYGTRTPASYPYQEVGSGTSNVPVSAVLSGLIQKTTYHFRVVLYLDGIGYKHGVDRTFTTLAALHEPTVVTEPASDVHAKRVTLNALINPHGAETQYQFEWSHCEDPTFFAKIPVPAKAVGAGTTNVGVNYVLTGLYNNSCYKFRAVATNSEGAVVYGQQQEVTTPKPKPQVFTEEAEGVTSTGATLYGTVNPEGYATGYWFEYDTKPYALGEGAHGTSVPIPHGEAGTGESDVAVSQTLGNLEPGQTYHFRIRASNFYGSAEGADESFRTLSVSASAYTAFDESGPRYPATIEGKPSSNLVITFGGAMEVNCPSPPTFFKGSWSGGIAGPTNTLASEIVTSQTCQTNNGYSEKLETGTCYFTLRSGPELEAGKFNAGFGVAPSTCGGVKISGTCNATIPPGEAMGGGSTLTNQTGGKPYENTVKASVDAALATSSSSCGSTAYFYGAWNSLKSFNQAGSQIGLRAKQLGVYTGTGGFEAEEYPSLFFGDQVATSPQLVGTNSGQSIKCADVELNGFVNSATTTLSVAPAYAGCTTTDIFGIVHAVVATVKTCTYVLHSTGSMDVACEHSWEGVEFAIYTNNNPNGTLLCTVKVGPQTGIGGVTYKNIGVGNGRGIEVTLASKGISMSRTGSTLCGQETGTGEYKGSSRLYG